MEESLYWLIEAQKEIDAIPQISLEESFLESEKNLLLQEAVVKHVGRALVSIKNIFDSLIKLVRKLLDSIGEFIAKGFMSADEKIRYANFKKLVQQNPQLKGMKVNIASFREFEKVFDSRMKEVEKMERSGEVNHERVSAILGGLDEDINGIMNKADRFVLSTTLGTALEIADADAESARLINMALKKELISLEDYRKHFGDAAASKVEKKLQSYADNGFFHRLKVNILGKKNKTLQGILKKQGKQLLSFTNLGDSSKPIVTKGSIARGALSNPKRALDTMGGVKGISKDVSKVVGNKVDDIRDNHERNVRAKEKAHLRYFLTGKK